MKHWFSDLNAFRHDPLQFLIERGNAASEPLLPLALGPRKVFLVIDPELVKPLLKADERDLDKGRLVHKMESLVGRSSLTISGEEHRCRREPVNEQLSRGHVERLVPLMAAEIRHLSAHLTQRSIVDVHAVTAQLAVKLICIALFGRNVLSPQDEHALIKAMHSVEDDLADAMFRLLPLTPWAYLARRKRQIVAQRTMSIVVQNVRSKATGASVLKTLEGLGLGEEAIRDEVLTMLLAGHHTTGSAGAWLLYHLAIEPGLIDAVAAEARDISDAFGEIRPERLKSAALSLSVVREILRLYPSAWWFSREVKRGVNIGGRSLAPGDTVIVSPWQLHRDPRHWAEPDRFRLDRPYTSRAYVPFGAGPRACVGMGVAMMELQLLALEIAATYQIANVAVDPAPQPRASLTLLPPHISMQFRLRERASSRECAA
jgi:cytochrome P450